MPHEAYNAIVEAAKKAAKLRLARAKALLLNQPNSPYNWGCLSSDRKTVKFQDGTIANAQVVGNPPQCGPVTRVGPGLYLAQGPAATCITITSSGRGFSIIYRQDPITFNYEYYLFSIKDGDNPNNYYKINALDIAGVSSGYADQDQAYQLQFSPDGKSIFVAFLKNSGVDVVVSWGLAFNWSLSSDSLGNKVVGYQSITNQFVNYNLSSSLLSVVIPKDPGITPTTIPDFVLDPIVPIVYSYPFVSSNSGTSAGAIGFFFDIYNTPTGPQADIIGNGEVVKGNSNLFRVLLNGSPVDPDPDDSTIFNWTNSTGNFFEFQIKNGSSTPQVSPVSYILNENNNPPSTYQLIINGDLRWFTAIPTITQTTSDQSQNWQFYPPWPNPASPIQTFSGAMVFKSLQEQISQYVTASIKVQISTFDKLGTYPVQTNGGYWNIESDEGWLGVTGIILLGSKIVTVSSGTGGFVVGQQISGVGIPDSTVVNAIIDSQTIELSNNATATGATPLITPTYPLPPNGLPFCVTDKYMFMDRVPGPFPPPTTPTVYDRPAAFLDGTNPLAVKAITSTQFLVTDSFAEAGTKLTLQIFNGTGTPTTPNTVGAGKKMTGPIFDKSTYTLVDSYLFI